MAVAIKTGRMNVEKRKQAIFRVDGGKVFGISFGHIKRSLILARALSSEYVITYVMKNYADGVDFVRKSGFHVEVIPVSDDSDDTLAEIFERLDPGLIVFDLYSNPYCKIFDLARTRAAKSVVFEITATCEGRPDVVVNDSIVEEALEYQSKSELTKYAMGPKYFFMDSYPNPAPISESLDSIVVTFGGADPSGATAKILKALREIEGFDIPVKAVLGPTFGDGDEIDKLAFGLENFTILKSPSNFLELIANADLVICAGGRTLYEAATLERPVLVVPTIKHEAKIARRFCDITGCRMIEILEGSCCSNELAECLRSYSDRISRANFSRCVRKLTDAQGLQRVIELVRN